MNRTLAQQAHRRILRMILDGSLPPGEILQEAALGTRLRMSRTPVREATKRILDEGLVEVRGRFTQVRRIGAAEVEEVFFIRLMLETDTARRALHIRPAILDAMEQRIIELMRNGPVAEDVERDTDDAFHRMIADAAGNRTAAKLIADTHRRTCIFDHALVPARFLKGCAEHLDIIDALRNGDGPRASKAMHAHLEGARDAILRRLDSLQPERGATP